MDRKAFTARERRLIGGLTLVFFGLILVVGAFNIAVPQIRTEYALSADATSWFTIVFSLPFILLMPFYGRLGDLLGKRQLLMSGGIVFSVGSLVCLFSQNAAMLIAGRIIQGIGAASVNPLCLSIIVQQIEPEKRGKAIGTWQSSGPIAAVLGPLLGGFLIEAFGWRSIFIPSTVLIAVSIPLMFRLLPKDATGDGAKQALRTHDWPGFVLLSIGMTAVVFYVSSRVITGRPPLQDWRILATASAAIVLFVFRERYARRPFVDLSLLKKRNFLIASSCVGIRMFLMGGFSFLLPLFMTDAFGVSAAKTGTLFTVNSVALLVSMRFGGIVADRFSNRYPVIIGLALQAAGFALLAVQAGSSNIALAVTVLALNGTGAGLCLTALHHSALHDVAPENSGAGAGLYSMIRFTGSLFGSAVAGIILEKGVRAFSSTGAAYRGAFIVLAAAGLVGVLFSTLLKEIIRKKN